MENEFRRQLVALLPRLSRFAFSLTRSRPAADDLTQAACERALGRFGQWQPETRLDSWMFRIMYTIWLNEVRAKAVRQYHEPRLQPFVGIADGESSLQARLMLLEVVDAALRLPQEQRVVLMLVCVEDLTYREAAEVVGVPIGTIMSRLARARLSLMKTIGAADDAASENVVRMASKCRS